MKPPVKALRVDGKPSDPRGLRVVADAPIPANRYLDTYPGKMYHEDDHTRLVKKGTRVSTYAWGAFKVNPDGEVDRGWTLDPATVVNGAVRLDARGHVAPFVNEPGPRQVPNAYWVYNLREGTVELWSWKRIKAGDEVLACYGPDYERAGYTSACQSKKVQPVLHVLWDPRRTTPEPFATATRLRRFANAMKAIAAPAPSRARARARSPSSSSPAPPNTPDDANARPNVPRWTNVRTTPPPPKRQRPNFTNVQTIRRELYDLARTHAELVGEATRTSGAERERLLRDVKAVRALAREWRDDLREAGRPARAGQRR